MLVTVSARLRVGALRCEMISERKGVGVRVRVRERAVAIAVARHKKPVRSSSINSKGKVAGITMVIVLVVVFVDM